MSSKLLADMPAIIRMTQSGQLQDATRAIQQAVMDQTSTSPTNKPTEPAVRAPMEGVFRVLDEGAKFAQRAADNHAVHTRTRPTPEPLRKNNADGNFITGAFTNQSGTRDYKLYVPSTAQDKPMPLVVMLHGCKQNPDDFAAGTRMNELAEEQPCLVLYPAQTPSANLSKCWNWFQQSDQRRDQGEPSIIAGLTRQIMGEYAVDPRRVYVAGLSAGGAMAVVMAKTYPELYAAAGVHSGLAYAAAHDIPSALTAMRHGKMTPSPTQTARANGSDESERIAPTIVFHGDRDTTVNPRNSEQLIAQIEPAATSAEQHSHSQDKPRVAVQSGQTADGHAHTRSVYSGADGKATVEHWLVHGAGHAWAGGSADGSYTDPKGPDASREMLRFFSEHPLPNRH